MDALIQEKKQAFVDYLPKNIKICTKIGQLDSVRPNVLVITPEYLFTLMKSDPSKLKNPELAIIDEVYLLSSESRGMGLDLSMTFLKYIFKNIQFLIMSATISFGNELKDWVNGDYIEDSFRAVELDTHVEISANRTKDIIKQVLLALQNDQTIAIFRRTKPNVHTLAARLTMGQIDYPPLTAEEETYFIEKFQKITKKTNSDDAIELYLRLRIGIHHKDIREEYKRICEEAVRRKIVKIVICTTTLGLGVNFPFDKVIISEPRLGTEQMTPSTFIQLAGRAGRYGYSTRGESYLFVSNEEQQKYWEGVRDGEVSLDPPKRLSDMDPAEVTHHILRLINTRFFITWKNLADLEGRLFASHISKDQSKVIMQAPSFAPGLKARILRSPSKDIFSRIGKLLSVYKLVSESEQGLRLTNLGRIAFIHRVEPHILASLANYFSSSNIKETSIEKVILTTAKVLELRAIPSPEVKRIYDIPTYKMFKHLGIPIEVHFQQNKKGLLNDKIAPACAIMYSWLSGMEEKDICEIYGIWTSSFNFIRKKLASILEDFAQWVLSQKKDQETYIILHIFSKQIEHGIAEELVPLAQIPYIARKRSKQIYEALKHLDRQITEEEAISLLEHIDLHDYHPEAVSEVWNPETPPRELLLRRNERKFNLIQIIDQIRKEEETRDSECKSELGLSTIPHKKTLAKEVGAFANAQGGFLVIGLTDDVPHEVVGVRVRDYKRETISQVINTRLTPSFDGYEYTNLEFEGVNLIVLEIRAHTMPDPLYLDGRIPYRKDGSSVYLKDLEEYRNFKGS